LSKEQIIIALTRLGLSRTDVEIYLYLAIKGRQRAKDIAEGLNIPKQMVYRSIKRLIEKGTISLIRECTTSFSAFPFESILKDREIEKINSAHSLEKNKAKILCIWASYIKERVH
jgi:sugar-specific transcriptional regulator TrmB